MEFITKSFQQTQKVGQEIADNLVKQGHRIFALTGNLGSGKTTFAQGFAKGLGIDQQIVSPSFIIVRSYSLPSVKKNIDSKLYHIDLYRLEENFENEIKNLGIDEILANQENIILIEWAERVRKYIPKNAVWVKFEDLGGNKRKISVNI